MQDGMNDTIQPKHQSAFGFSATATTISDTMALSAFYTSATPILYTIGIPSEFVIVQ